MKRIAFILAILFMTATSISAQVVPGMKYSELKGIYNPRNYVKTDADPYSMLWSGVASFAVPGLGLGVAAGNFCYWIWNICDARKVAKVKNMYYQDLQKHAFEFNMYPTVNYAMTSNGMKPVAGMTMSMQF